MTHYKNNKQKLNRERKKKRRTATKQKSRNYRERKKKRRTATKQKSRNYREKNYIDPLYFESEYNQNIYICPNYYRYKRYWCSDHVTHMMMVNKYGSNDINKLQILRDTYNVANTTMANLNNRNTIPTIRHYNSLILPLECWLLILESMNLHVTYSLLMTCTELYSLQASINLLPILLQKDNMLNNQSGNRLMNNSILFERLCSLSFFVINYVNLEVPKYYEDSISISVFYERENSNLMLREIIYAVMHNRVNYLKALLCFSNNLLCSFNVFVGIIRSKLRIHPNRLVSHFRALVASMNFKNVPVFPQKCSVSMFLDYIISWKMMISLLGRIVSIDDTIIDICRCYTDTFGSQMFVISQSSLFTTYKTIWLKQYNNIHPICFDNNVDVSPYITLLGKNTWFINTSYSYPKSRKQKINYNVTINGIHKPLKVNTLIDFSLHDQDKLKEYIENKFLINHFNISYSLFIGDKDLLNVIIYVDNALDYINRIGLFA